MRGSDLFEMIYRQGDVFEYWTVQMASPHRICHFRATYYESLPWNAHPWAKEWEDRGAPFQDDWAIEEEGQDGWDRRGRASGCDWPEHVLSSDSCYATRVQAAEALIERLRARLTSLYAEIAVLGRVLQHYKTELTDSDVSC